MKMFKKNDGFTLVELIVVIAILAILAGVATAGYSAYIKKANNSAVNSELTNLSTAAIIANAEAGQITSITVVSNSDGKNIDVTILADSFAKDFKTDFETSYKVKLTEKKDNDKLVGYTFSKAEFSSWDASDYAAVEGGTVWTGTSWSK